MPSKTRNIKVGKYSYRVIRTPFVHNPNRFFYTVKRSDSKLPGSGNIFYSIKEIENHYKNLKGKIDF